MADAYTPSPEATEQLRETFDFFRHEREDVRKMAVRGIAEHSKDNRDLWAFMSSKADGGKSVELLLQFLHAGSSNILGDILTILINVSAEGSCAETLVQHKVVRKAMRLLDGMERSVLPDPYVRSVQEMTFMLLSNLTASHVSAIDDLLQKEDEDMRGFYLGKLQRYYEFLNEEAEKAKAGAAAAAESSTNAASEAKKDDAAAEADAPPQRDLQRWILRILLNITRTYDGQELLLEDADWRTTLNGCLASPNPFHRLIAAQCFRNCACSQKPQYALLLQSEALLTAVSRLASREERSPEVQLCLAEFLASMMESEEGMAKLEGVNAKKMLLETVTESRTMAAAAAGGEDASPSSRVEEVDDDGNPIAPQPPAAASAPPTATDDVDGDGVLPSCVAPPPLDAEACDVLEKHVLPYLDDVIDAYLAPGSDALD